MRALVIGNLSSVYVFNFIVDTLLKMKPDTVVLLNTAEEIKLNAKEYLHYYKQNGILVIGNGLKYPANIAECYRVIKRMGQFDVCHIHSLNYVNIKAGICLGKFCNRVIVNYWGSDWLRADNSARCQQEELLQISDYIVSDSREICEQIKEYYAGSFNDRLRFIRFKLPVVEELKHHKITEDIKTSFIKKYNIPQKKMIIACGYNGRPAHRHLEIIKAIKNMSSEKKSMVFVIVQATYGSDVTYIKEINDCLESAGVDAVILKEFLSVTDVACLRSLVDVFINMQLTDASCSSLLEYLYLNKVIINGSWLNYSDLEQAGASFIKVDNIPDLTAALENVIECWKLGKNQISNGASVVEKYHTPFEKRELWEELYFMQPKFGEEKTHLREVTQERGALFLNESLKVYYLRNMLCIENIEQKIKMWLDHNRLNKIGIYGAGHLGEAVYEKIKGSPLQFLCVIDKFAQKTDWFPGKLVAPGEVEEGWMDAIIITPVLHFDEIKNEFASKFNCVMLTLAEWIDELKQEETR